jgi:hypothetical protein
LGVLAGGSSVEVKRCNQEYYLLRRESGECKPVTQKLVRSWDDTGIACRRVGIKSPEPCFLSRVILHPAQYLYVLSYYTLLPHRR